MSLLHIGVALGLSAAAAFLVTGATMRPIQPDAAACTVGGHAAAAETSCLPVGDIRPAVSMSNIQPDAGPGARGR
ncbi:MAG: hypothetical protein J0H60_18265 [Rhizobiales bacterium]|jgi:hypothetical protein|nr:hypothetical protein [Hyphomicrobiales bacterium]MBN9247863.1 hypothetical protein [Hyphomicrobium sp.]